ncbi:hypothetical protein MUK42_37756 [Musa troglodytarum]|uniref:Uncharacterized protein n=1 Tax=Musa troglodytarum TaxID=320322 RepID=A0A9E7K3M5_9LILI|nr:hypothetical protein MUK42_37756 [Musa troglodytarum]
MNPQNATAERYDIFYTSRDKEKRDRGTSSRHPFSDPLSHLRSSVDMNRRIHANLVMFSYVCQVNDILSSRKESLSDSANVGLLGHYYGLHSKLPPIEERK